MEASASSSKVTVEYHDPSGVFPLLADDIFDRLPLRNLNWQSSSRPLRQIKSLHVDLVADAATQNNLRPSTARTDNDGPNSFDIVGGGSAPVQVAVKERRHQIPGLKTSPYLKIYVLRCDDKEGYKDAERKRIRDWIRDNSQNDARRDNHDAFEWMILHVVIPDTVAASEPRWRDSTSKESDELQERPKTNAKWPGKNTKTVFDRLRADFNESGKSGHDRVAQIRLLKSDMPPDLLPTPAIAPTLEESSQERVNAWQDLISKFKTFILASFDLRVRQYEADIAEQESRRALPGWNFCTFFIHKEGLAKALESIGLVEDALAIYDELSIGLDTTVRDLASGRAEGTATSFASYTDDIQDRIMGTIRRPTDANVHNGMQKHDNDTTGLFVKDYRERIVMSNISVFDFASYIFSRQKTLILRLSNARSARVQLSEQNKDGGEDLVLTSEVCWRSSNFIHTGARMLRQDLSRRISSQPGSTINLDTDGLVNSWTYTVAGQVLQETTTSVLQDLTNPERLKQNGTGGDSRRRLTIGLGAGADAYPQRSASLPGRKSNPPDHKRPSSRSSATGADAFRSQSTPGSNFGKPASFPGQAELATYRAELFLVRRKILAQLAARRNWYAGWASIRHEKPPGLENIDLKVSEPSNSAAEIVDPPEMLNTSLILALESKTTFWTSFEHLTDLAIRHYSAATQSKSAESLMGDMAILKAQQHDHSAALSYFKHIVPQYATESWSLVTFEALKTYSTCLKGVQRHYDYVQTVLSLLANAFSRRLGWTARTAKLMSQTGSDCEEMQGVPGMLSGLVAESASLPREIIVSAEKYFTDIQLNKEINLSPDEDGFFLRLHFQHLLDDEIEVEASAQLVSIDDSALEIWPRSKDGTVLHPGLNTFDLHAPTVACGGFLINKIVLKAGNIRFEYEVQPRSEQTPLTTAETRKDEGAPGFQIPPFVYVYPAEHAFNATVNQGKDAKIGKSRSLEIALESGRNDIQSIELKIKPNTAGLRLHVADATCSDIALATGQGAKQSQLSLSQLRPLTRARVIVPYTVEQNMKDISVRLEVSYSTAMGSYTLLSSASVPHALPLDVDVNDHFHLDLLYSQFTVRAIDPIPVSITEVRLEESEVFAVRSPPFIPLPTAIFSSQPMQLVYQISRKPAKQSNTIKLDSALALKLRYQMTDETFYDRLHHLFSADLKASSYSSFSRLLIPVLMERSKHLIANTDLEMAAMLGKVKVFTFDAIGWDDVLATLKTPIRDDLQVWLQHWHDDHQQLHIGEDVNFEESCRTITISVDVPAVNTVFSGSLNVIHPHDWLHHGAPIVTLGSPIHASVRIRYSNVWMAESMSNKTSNDQAFVCEIHAEPDTWLIGGQRRSHFTPKDGSEHKFAVVLIPLQTGCQALPLIEVHLAAPTTEESATPRTTPAFSYETHYESAGQTVQVIRDATSTRVDIIDSPIQPTSPTAETASVMSKQAV